MQISGSDPHYAMLRRPWFVLILFLVASVLVSVIGGLATASSVETWYLTLAKPSWNPPSQVFGPAWTLLYGLMAIAAWRIWLRRDRPEARTALWVYAAQLVLNVGWSILFFGLRNPGAALIEIVLLWSTLVWLLFRFWKIDRVAGILWLPYVLWVTFATSLNAAIWSLN